MALDVVLISKIDSAYQKTHKKTC